MDVIDEVIEEKLDALLNETEPFLSTSKNINETSLNKEFEGFMAIDVEEIPEQEEEIDDNFEELPFEEKLRIKTSIQEPPTDLEMKPLPKHLEYAFMEKDYLLLVVISALLKTDEKKRLVSILKNHKEAFAWKTFDIPVVKKKIIKLLDADIIYPIEDSPWVSHVHCVPKKGGMAIVTNEKNKLVPTRTVTGWRGIDFIGPLPKSHKFEYILVAIDYVSKWAEAEALPSNDARVVINFLKKLFSCFGIPKALISDKGTHFCNKQLEKILKRYGVHHCFATTYHP
ncbi:reverse transcriptase domain-containing protein [Tanacetum coccineum]